MRAAGGLPAIAPIATSRRAPSPSAGDAAVTPDDVVSDRAGDEHPGGSEGLRTEESLEPGERQFFRAAIEDAIDQRFGPIHLVVSLAYQQVLRRRFQNHIEIARLKTHGAVIDARPLAALQNADDAILKLTQALERIREGRIIKTDDPRELLESQLADAERWVQGQIGELQFGCPSCQAVLLAPELPHWAFSKNETSQGPEYAVWSPELWTLVLSGEISLATMAFVLRTSPEGLMLTARRRKESWPESIVLEAEERRVRELLDAQERAAAAG